MLLNHIQVRQSVVELSHPRQHVECDELAANRVAGRFFLQDFLVKIHNRLRIARPNRQFLELLFQQLGVRYAGGGIFGLEFEVAEIVFSRLFRLILLFRPFGLKKQRLGNSVALELVEQNESPTQDRNAAEKHEEEFDIELAHANPSAGEVGRGQWAWCKDKGRSRRSRELT